jgi:hypothetical protein
MAKRAIGQNIKKKNTIARFSLMSRLLDGYRAVGVICTDTPFVVNHLGAQSFLTVPIGNAFQVYKCDKLTLSLVSPQLQHDIR